MMLVAGIIGGLYSGWVTPTEAGAAGAFLALLIAVLQGRMTPALMWSALKDAMLTTSQIFFVGMGALMFTRLLSLSGASRTLADLVAPLGLDPVLILLAVTVVYLILGMFLDPVGIMLITMPVFLPLMKALEMDLVWFGVLVVKFIEIGMLTPPLGFNVFVVKGVVGDSIPLTTIFRGVGVRRPRHSQGGLQALGIALEVHGGAHHGRRHGREGVGVGTHGVHLPHQARAHHVGQAHAHGVAVALRSEAAHVEGANGRPPVVARAAVDSPTHDVRVHARAAHVLADLVEDQEVDLGKGQRRHPLPCLAQKGGLESIIPVRKVNGFPTSMAVVRTLRRSIS
jgi:hypothetical protein